MALTLCELEMRFDSLFEDFHPQGVLQSNDPPCAACLFLLTNIRHRRVLIVQPIRAEHALA